MGALIAILKQMVFRHANRRLSSSVRTMRRLHPEWSPRTWSNKELRHIGGMFEGDVINVSGWEDSDKEGGNYAEYFPNKKSYAISNIGGTRGQSQREDELMINLEKEIDSSLVGGFDVVFNHTTLEHVFDVSCAFDVLCGLTRDVVIVVVPFMQIEHWAIGSYGDYHRFTEFAVRRYLEERGLGVLYLSSNHNPVFPIYYFCVASKKPARWKKLLEFAPLSSDRVDELGNRKRSIGQSYPMME